MTINNPVLGELKFDKHLEQYLADVGDVEFMIATESVVATAQEIALELERWEVTAKKYASRKLLKLKNETWTDEDDDGNETLVTANEFRDRMTLNAVNVYEDGSSTFWFSDGDLFYGHAIEVRVRNGKCDEAVISG